MCPQNSRASRQPRLHANFVNASMATLAGYGSRELLTRLTGRPPLWSAISRAWVTTPATLTDAIAAAERDGIAVTVADDDPLPTSRGRLF